MAWHVFDAVLQGRPAPDFQMENNLGQRVTLMDFRNRANLVLMFLPSGFPQANGHLKSALHALGDELAERNSRLAIASNALPALNSDHEERFDTPFYQLSDPGGISRGLYAGLLPESDRGGVLAFVLDRYAAPVAALVAAESAIPLKFQEIIDWVDYIELQCPE